MRLLLTLIILFSISTVSFSQKTYFIKDGVSNDVIPFVKVLPVNDAPFLSDIDGKIIISENIQQFTLRYSGYKDTLIQMNLMLDSIIYIYPSYQEINEVVALAGENPAHRIMSQAINNRKKKG